MTMTTPQQQNNNKKATQLPLPPHISSVTKISYMFLGALIMLLCCCMSCFIPNTTTTTDTTTSTTTYNVDQLGPYLIIFFCHILVCVGVIVTQTQAPSIAVNVTIGKNSTSATTSSDEEDEEEEDEAATITASESDETDDQTEAVAVAGTGDEAAATDQVAADFERLFPVWARAMIKTLPDMNYRLVLNSAIAIGEEFDRMQGKVDPAITAEIMPCFAALTKPGGLVNVNISLTEIESLMSEFASALSSLLATGPTGGAVPESTTAVATVSAALDTSLLVDNELTIDDGGNPGSVTTVFVSEEDVGLVASQAQVTREVALETLAKFDGQVVESILHLAQ